MTNIQIYRAIHRYTYKSDWLTAYQTFYPDEEQGFFAITDINENHLKPALGFPVSTFTDTEIITLILQGGISHQDNLGHLSILRLGDVQLVSAGSGITQSELNASDKERAIFFQFRIKPNRLNLAPRYQKKQISSANHWQLIISPDGKEGSLQIQQDMNMYLLLLDKSRELTHTFPAGRAGWLQLLEGKLTLGDQEIEAGDAAAIAAAQQISLKAQEFSRALLFDLSVN